MKPAWRTFRYVAAIVSGCLSIVVAACQHYSAVGAAVVSEASGGTEDAALVLPTQYRTGLRIDGVLRTWPTPGSRSHTLDLRLTNTGDEMKQFVGVENVTLDNQFTYFRKPPVETLYRRGSAVDFPSLASWDLRETPLPAHYPLGVTVRYQGRHGNVVATIQWDVQLGRDQGPTASPATAPQTEESSAG
jgi:hypothetical protein